MDNFDVKTLFYIFYYMPRDSLQLYAADHLYKMIGYIIINIKFGLRKLKIVKINGNILIH